MEPLLAGERGMKSAVVIHETLQTFKWNCMEEKEEMCTQHM